MNAQLWPSENLQLTAVEIEVVFFSKQNRQRSEYIAVEKAEIVWALNGVGLCRKEIRSSLCRSAWSLHLDPGLFLCWTRLVAPHLLQVVSGAEILEVQHCWEAWISGFAKIERQSWHLTYLLGIYSNWKGFTLGMSTTP